MGSLKQSHLFDLVIFTTLVENLLLLSDPLAFVQNLFCQSHCTTVSGRSFVLAAAPIFWNLHGELRNISLSDTPQTDSVKASAPALHGPAHLLSFQSSGLRPQ